MDIVSLELYMYFLHEPLRRSTSILRQKPSPDKGPQGRIFRYWAVTADDKVTINITFLSADANGKSNCKIAIVIINKHTKLDCGEGNLEEGGLVQ